MRTVFLGMNTNNKEDTYDEFLVQNTEDYETSASNEVSDVEILNTIEQQDVINGSALNSKSNKTFAQCSSAGDIYSEDELNE